MVCLEEPVSQEENSSFWQWLDSPSGVRPGVLLFYTRDLIPPSQPQKDSTVCPMAQMGKLRLGLSSLPHTRSADGEGSLHRGAGCPGSSITSSGSRTVLQPWALGDQSHPAWLPSCHHSAPNRWAGPRGHRQTIPSPNCSPSIGPFSPHFPLLRVCGHSLGLADTSHVLISVFLLTYKGQSPAQTSPLSSRSVPLLQNTSLVFSKALQNSAY